MTAEPETTHTGTRDHLPFWGVVAMTAVAVIAVVAAVVAPGPPAPAVGPGPAPAPPLSTTSCCLTTFRGNASRSYYGEGPVPTDPTVQWVYPGDGSKMCADSAEGGPGSEVKQWCGTGWTGQPNVVANRDGSMMVRVGAYDDHYHFLDAATGQQAMPDLVTGDLAKGSATSDPDGYPLYYAGSRDNIFRVVALDRAEPTVLWSMDSHDTSLAARPMWNDDWDGAALVIDDVLIEGGENGWLYLVRLNRGYDAQGLVTVHPDPIAVVPGFDQALLDAV